MIFYDTIIIGDNMNNKKGFTLIELLAVILILGIIALIAIPVVTDILKEARKMAFKNSVVGVYKAIENNNGGKGFQNNEEYIYSNNKLQYIISNDVNLENPEIIGIKGNIENGYGIGKVDGDGKITLAIQNGTYCAYNENGDLKFNVIEGDCGDLIVSSQWTDDACFEYDESTETITGYDASCGTNVVIPPTINNKKVKHIGEWAFVGEINDYIAWVKNPYGSYDFPVPYSMAIEKGYEILAKDPIKSIGNYSIECYRDGVGYEPVTYGTSIEDAKCSNYYVIDDETEYAGGDIKSLNLSYLVDLETIEEGSFYRSNISKLNISGLKKLTKIGNSAFIYNNINDIYLKNLDNLELIDKMAFYTNGEYGKNYLINLPKLKRIDDLAFYYNYSDLKLENLPNLEYIGEAAFSWLKGHEGELDLTNTKLKYIGLEAFYYTDIPSLKLPSSVEYIGTDAFSDSYITGTLDLSNLTNVNNQLDYLAWNDFENVILPPVPNLELKAYSLGSSNLKTLIIPSNVIAIEQNALVRYGLDGLTKIVNLTGKSFDWGLAFGGSSNIFETGTYTDSYGTVEIVNIQ